jgi:4-amino-4-deoxy-L-arabinose transferase-like glycosyltransferase
MSDSSQATPAARSPRPAMRVLAGLSVATVVFHLAFGLYYATRTEHLISRPTLRMQGEQYLRSFAGWGEQYEGDAASYNYVATEVLRSGIARTRSGALYLHAPVYAYFLAGCYKLGGLRLLSVAVPNALLAGLTCWLLGLAAWRLAPRRKEWAACVAGALFFVNLRMAMYVAYVSPTHLLLFLSAVALWTATRVETSAGVFWFAVAIVAGILTQAAFFVSALAAALWLFIELIRHKRPAQLAGALVIVLAAGARPAVTMIAAQRVREDHLSQSASGVLWEANNPYYESMRWTSLWERRPGNPWTRWQVSEDEQQRYDEYWTRTGQTKSQAGWLWVRENPAQYAKLCWIRLRTELGPFTGQMSPRNRMISTFFWLLVFPAGYWGLWKLRRLEVSLLVALMLAAILSFSTLVIVEWYLRYRMPVELMLMAYAATAYAAWADTLLGRRSGALTTAANAADAAARTS